MDEEQEEEEQEEEKQEEMDVNQVVRRRRSARPRREGDARVKKKHRHERGVRYDGQ